MGLSLVQGEGRTSHPWLQLVKPLFDFAALCFGFVWCVVCCVWASMCGSPRQVQVHCGCEWTWRPRPGMLSPCVRVSGYADGIASQPATGSLSCGACLLPGSDSRLRACTTPTYLPIYIYMYRYIPYAFRSVRTGPWSLLLCAMCVLCQFN